MLVVCNGMPRSASTWSYNVAMRLLRDAASGEVYGGYDDDLDRFIRGLPATASHAVLKCHSLDPTGLGLAQLAAAKVIYTWRDLADATSSFMTMFGADFDQAITAISNSLDLLARHRRNGALIIGYEAVLNDGVGSVRRIADHIGVGASEAQLVAIADELSLGKVREQVDKIGSSGDGQNLVAHDATQRPQGLKHYVAHWLQRVRGRRQSSERQVYDRETLLHVEHIRHGGVGYGKAALTAAQQRRVAELIREKAPFESPTADLRH